MNSNHWIPPGTQRVFIGIPIDKQSQQHINELLKPIKNSRRDIRWVPENNRHLTLAFLGDRPISEVKNLIQLFDESYQQETRFQFRLSTLERFPNSMGRIIALTNEPSEPLGNLFQITLKLLQRNEIEFDRKKFRPHVTLGRIRRPKHVKKTFDRQINIKVDITRIRLFQSTFTDSGSIYSALKETLLI
jgi:2'-5' RNA ligase